MKILWFWNLGPVLVAWAVLMLTSASASQIGLGCLGIYVLGCILDVVHWKMGITPSHQSER